MATPICLPKDTFYHLAITSTSVPKPNHLAKSPNFWHYRCMYSTAHPPILRESLTKALLMGSLRLAKDYTFVEAPFLMELVLKDTGSLGKVGLRVWYSLVLARCRRGEGHGFSFHQGKKGRDFPKEVGNDFGARWEYFQ